MKNSVNSDQLLSKAESLVKECHNEYMHYGINASTQESILSTSQNGGTSSTSFLAGIHNHYNNLKSKVMAILNPTLQIHQGSTDREHCNNECNALLQKSSELVKKAGILRDKPQRPWLVIYLIGVVACLAIIAGLLVSEIHYLTDALQFIVSDQDKAFIVAVGLCISFYLVVHFLPELLEKIISNDKIRRIITGTVYLITCGLLYYLGFLRSKYMLEMNNIDSPPWPFISITMLLFVSMTIVTQMLLKPLMVPLEEALITIYNRFKLKRVESEIKVIHKAIKEKEDMLKQTLAGRYLLVNKAKEYDNSINFLYNDTCLTAIDNYRRKNPDSLPTQELIKSIEPLIQFTEGINI